MTSSGSRRSTAFRAARLIIVAAAVLLLLPYLLAPLYRVVDPASTLMLGRWVTGKRVDRAWMPLGKIATVLPRTVIASEDGQFCRHRGVDLAELREAIGDIL